MEPRTILDYLINLKPKDFEVILAAVQEGVNLKEAIIQYEQIRRLCTKEV